MCLRVYTCVGQEGPPRGFPSARALLPGARVILHTIHPSNVISGENLSDNLNSNTQIL